jgi:hypothetical protein
VNGERPDGGLPRALAIAVDAALATLGVALVALLATLAVGCGGGGGGGGADCAVVGATPDYVERLGCPADYAALGYDEDPFVTFARTTSVSMIVDRRAGRVYFLDTEKWWLHWDFVWQVLEGHAPGEPGEAQARAAFNNLNYYSEDRRYILAKIVQYHDQGQLVLSLAAGDRAGAALVEEAFAAARTRLFDGERLRWRPVSNDQERLVAALGGRVPIVTSEALFAGQTYQPLNATIGYGTLRFVRATQLAATPPLPTEIVVLDRVPGDVPVVSGIVTGEFQTPLSHVNILAKNRGTPNFALRGAWDEPRLRALEGQLVELTVSPEDFAIAPATPAAAQAYWDALRPDGAFTPAYDPTATALVDLASAGVEDLPRVGAKAANFAQMGQAFPPVNRPTPAYAVPLSAFDAHLTRHGLWAEVEAIVAERAAGTLDDAALGKRLFHLRLAIYEAPLDPALRDALYAPLAAAFGATEVRLRSSTNAEDLAGFSGAGLYTSVGVRLDEGPDTFERGLKVVWASAWNPAAFVEREFYRIDQRAVRMGVLVHPSFGQEAANGVALTANDFSELRPAYFINAQVGDVSVANPSGVAVPEQILWYTYYQTPEYEVLSRSSLSPEKPVLTDAQYQDLATQLFRLRNHFNPIWCQIPGTTMVDPDCALDVEWKLDDAGQVWIKQARPLRAGGAP